MYTIVTRVYLSSWRKVEWKSIHEEEAMITLLGGKLIFPGRTIIREGKNRYKIYLPTHYNHILETIRRLETKVYIIIIVRNKQQPE